MRYFACSCLLLVLLYLALPALAQGTIAPGTAASAAQAAPLYANTHALLIGINAYQHVPTLNYAVNDVNALKDVLVTLYGFPAENITVLTDEQATLEGIRTALAQVASKAQVGKDDRVLIYFSGHGQTVPTPDGGAKGFLIRVDAAVNLDDLSDPAPYLATCVPMDMVWETLDLCQAKHVLLIADACYSGLLAKTRTLVSAAPAPTTDLAAQVFAGKRARQVMTAGGQGETTVERAEWGHGAFTYKLLDELRGRARVPGAKFTTLELFAELRGAVMNATDGKQTPQLADKDTEGEFLFTVPGAPIGDNIIAPPFKDTTAQLQLTTDPPGATVLLDGVAQTDKTPCTLSVELGAARTKMVEIGFTCAGYHDELREVSLERGQVTPVQVTLPIAPKINPKDGAMMMWIPAGEFTMGSDDGDNDEKPAHKVYLDSFWIYQHDVTVAQYRQFCTATGRVMPQAPAWGWIDDHPVVNVCWDDAKAYADWAGVALPTEAEWEKAARGGEHHEYVWGDAWPPPKGAGNFDDETCKASVQYNNWTFINGYTDGYVNTSPVGSFAANGYGLYDMAGNVWQWCADWCGADYYSNSPTRNPTGPETGVARVLRGGAWDRGEQATLRVAYRRDCDPTYNNVNLGFRCVSRSPGP